MLATACPMSIKMLAGLALEFKPTVESRIVGRMPDNRRSPAGQRASKDAVLVFSTVDTSM
jgi:hypothetical protein